MSAFSTANGILATAAVLEESGEPKLASQSEILAGIVAVQSYETLSLMLASAFREVADSEKKSPHRKQALHVARLVIEELLEFGTDGPVVDAVFRDRRKQVTAIALPDNLNLDDEEKRICIDRTFRTFGQRNVLDLVEEIGDLVAKNTFEPIRTASFHDEVAEKLATAKAEQAKASAKQWLCCTRPEKVKRIGSATGDGGGNVWISTMRFKRMSDGSNGAMVRVVARGDENPGEVSVLGVDGARRVLPFCPVPSVKG